MKSLAFIPLLLLLAACGGSSPSGVVVPQSGGCCGWTPQYSTGVTLQAAPQGFQFQFPTAPNSLHYLVTLPASLSLAGKSTVTAKWTITGAGKFQYVPDTSNTCGGPATAQLYFQRVGDDWLGGPYTQYFRWWHTTRTTIAPGSVTVTAKLDPADWSSVLGVTGDKAPTEFAAALSQIQAIGVTFGGGCFAGHGAQLASGSAIFNMQTYGWQ